MVDHEVNEPSDADGFAHVPVLLHRATIFSALPSPPSVTVERAHT